MSTYEGGVRVIFMLRWRGSVAAGVEDPTAAVMDGKTQYIDGLDNAAYWKGSAEKSARDHIFHCYEGGMTAIRMGNWEWHFATKEDYYADLVPLTAPLVFNIRADPFESYSSTDDSAGHLLQKVSWQMGPMNGLISDHLKSLADYPPVQW